MRNDAERVLGPRVGAEGSEKVGEESKRPRLKQDEKGRGSGRWGRSRKSTRGEEAGTGQARARDARSRSESVE